MELIKNAKACQNCSSIYLAVCYILGGIKDEVSANFKTKTKKADIWTMHPGKLTLVGRNSFPYLQNRKHKKELAKSYF